VAARFLDNHNDAPQAQGASMTTRLSAAITSYRDRAPSSESPPGARARFALTSYPRNSPAAIARVVALAMLADATVHPREIDAIDALGLHQELGISRDAFLTIVSECFAEAMIDMRARDRLRLVDDALVDWILADLDDPQACALAYRATLALLPADGRLSPEELAVLQRMFDRWPLRGEALTAGLS
jgi:hypothetical protein